MRTLAAKVGSMILANSSGLQVGAEGPMIHIGAIVGNGVSQMQSKEFGFKIPGMRHFRYVRLLFSLSLYTLPPLSKFKRSLN